MVFRIKIYKLCTGPGQTAESNELRDTVESLQQQLQMLMMEGRPKQVNSLVDNPEEIGGWLNSGGLSGELRYVEQNGSESDNHDRQSHTTSKDLDEGDSQLQSQLLMQVCGTIYSTRFSSDSCMKLLKSRLSVLLSWTWSHTVLLLFLHFVLGFILSPSPVSICSCSHFDAFNFYHLFASFLLSSWQGCWLLRQCVCEYG